MAPVLARVNLVRAAYLYVKVDALPPRLPPILAVPKAPIPSPAPINGHMFQIFPFQLLSEYGPTSSAGTLFTSLNMTMKIHIYRNKALVHGVVHVVQSWTTMYDSVLLVSVSCLSIWLFISSSAKSLGSCLKVSVIEVPKESNSRTP